MCSRDRNWKTPRRTTSPSRAFRSRLSTPSRRSCPCPSPTADWARASSSPQPVRDHLAHEVRQRLVSQRGERYPPHTGWRETARGNACRVNHELQWKMREDVVDHALLATPARDAFEQRRLLQRRVVVLCG